MFLQSHHGISSNTVSQLSSITFRHFTRKTHSSMLRSSPAKALPLHLILSDHSSPHSFSSHPRPGNHTGLVLQATFILSFLSSPQSFLVCQPLSLPVNYPFLFSLCVISGFLPISQFQQISQSLVSHSLHFLFLHFDTLA